MLNDKSIVREVRTGLKSHRVKLLFLRQSHPIHHAEKKLFT